MSGLNYDIELDEIRLNKDEIVKDNMQTIEKSLVKIQEILRDIEKRIEALE